MNWKVSTTVLAENVSDVVFEAPNDAMPVGTSGLTTNHAITVAC